MGFVTDTVLFGVDCCFLSNVFVLDPEFCHALIWSVMEFLPPSLCDGMTDPCRTRSDSGCLDLIHQDIEIKFILTYILRKKLHRHNFMYWNFIFTYLKEELFEETLESERPSFNLSV